MFLCWAAGQTPFWSGPADCEVPADAKEGRPGGSCTSLCGPQERDGLTDVQSKPRQCARSAVGHRLAVSGGDGRRVSEKKTATGRQD